MTENILKIETVKDKVELQIKQHRTMLNSFTSGLVFGVGSAIGATFIFGLIIYLLGSLNTVPFVGQYVENIINYIQSSSQ